MGPHRVSIHGVPADCVTRAGALEAVEDMMNGAQAQAVIALNPEKVMAARQNARLLESLQRAGLLLPDGIGVVWAARLLRLGHAERVPGCEFMLALCERAALRGYRIFLFGGAPDVNARAEYALRYRYPGIRIVGRQHGYVSEEDMAAVIQRINASGADIVFVALGSPKQELWIDTHGPDLRVKICQGVGGTFDVITGRVRRAPRLFLAARLEWLYRLMSQPNRLARQTALPRFAAKTLWAAAVRLAAKPAPHEREDLPVGLSR